jgi:hypothetical protein
MARLIMLMTLFMTGVIVLFTVIFYIFWFYYKKRRAARYAAVQSGPAQFHLQPQGMSQYGRLPSNDTLVKPVRQ